MVSRWLGTRWRQSSVPSLSLLADFEDVARYVAKNVVRLIKCLEEVLAGNSALASLTLALLAIGHQKPRVRS
jgi:hypothetical protein